MLIDEAECNNKWCPQTPAQDPASQGCIGTRCAAWRFHHSEHVTHPNQTDATVKTERYGYCGLAGKPMEQTHAK